MTFSPPFAVDGYTIDKPIGAGTAGTVYLAHPNCSNHRSTHSSQVAIKIVPRSKVHEAVTREVALHATFTHPNIVSLHHLALARQPLRSPSTSHRSSSNTIFPRSPAALALVMDYAPAGDMFDEVATMGCLTPRILRRHLKDISAALNYLHENGIAHLDVKLENVVISNSSTAKLIDFGCARKITSNRDSVLSTSLGGTLHYLSPEMAENQNRHPHLSSDAWSLGVLVYTALVGSYPFIAGKPGASDKENDAAIRHRIINCPPHRVPSSISIPSDLRRIIHGLLDKNPSTRMTIPQLIAELNRASDVRPIAIPATILPSPVPQSSHKKSVAEAARPSSPSGTADANFSPCTCHSRQTPEEALQVVYFVKQHRMRAAQDVHKFLSGTSIKEQWQTAKHDQARQQDACSYVSPSNDTRVKLVSTPN